MARNRMIKVEFWVDEKLGTVSRDARLLFICMWNMADDSGNLLYSAQRLRVQAFPYDNLDNDVVTSWVDELVEIGVVAPYSVNGKDFLAIPKFGDHQKINHPSDFRHPQVALSEGSSSPQDEDKDKEKTKTKTKPKEKTKTKERESGGGIFILFENSIGLIPPALVEELKDAEKTYPIEWLERAFTIACRQNKRRWAYVYGILKKWEVEGFDVELESKEKPTEIAPKSDPEEYRRRYGHMLKG